MVMRRWLFSASLAILGLLSATSRASAATIDFEALNHGDTGAVLAAYLAQYGVTTSYTDLNPNDCGCTGQLVVHSDLVVTWLDASSGHNFFGSSGNGAGIGTYTLFFNTGQDYVSFWETGILSPTATPTWSATAYNNANGVVASIGPFHESSTFPVHQYVLGVADSVNNIFSVQFNFDGQRFAGEDAPFIDDIFLPNSTFQDASAVPEPLTLLLVGSGLFGVGYDRRRRPASNGRNG